MTEKNDWWVFTKAPWASDEDPLERLRKDPPPWRDFGGGEDDPAPPSWRNTKTEERDRRRGQTFVPNDDVVNLVNAALYLRRPLLVTGNPGTGKSSLAYAIADRLRLGPVLTWPINTRTTLQDGMYRYDAISRLRAAVAGGVQSSQAASNPAIVSGDEPPTADDVHAVGRYIRLGPLGTALLPWRRPRVLLIDEIDKSDVDLPNDLLHVFEEGKFVIPELTRLLENSDHDPDAVVKVSVQTAEEQMRAIPNGEVRCTWFPVVILTSNRERDFPPAFLRRCLRLDMRPPDPKELATIVENHLGKHLFEKAEQQIRAYISDFVTDRDQPKTGDIATDQLLNLVYMTTRDLVDENLDLPQGVREKLKTELLRPLTP